MKAKKPKPKIYGDFNNADELGRIRLSTIGSEEDIARLGLVLNDGMEIEVDYDDELSADAIVRYSDSEKRWVAEIDWGKIRYKSE